MKVPGAGEEGVVITEVTPESDAADKGLKAGDVILQVAGVNVSDPGDVADGVKKAIEKAKDKPLEGFIGLQDSHSPKGHYVEYRNIKIKVLE